MNSEPYGSFDHYSKTDREENVYFESVISAFISLKYFMDVLDLTYEYFCGRVDYITVSLKRLKN